MPQHLSEMLALVACRFATKRERKPECVRRYDLVVCVSNQVRPRESLNLLTEFAEFTRLNGNVARLLAESRGYYRKLVEVRTVAATNVTLIFTRSRPWALDFSHCIAVDDTHISSLMTDLLGSPSGRNVVLSLAPCPCQAQALLHLVEKVRTASSTHPDPGSSPV